MLVSTKLPSLVRVIGTGSEYQVRLQREEEKLYTYCFQKYREFSLKLPFLIRVKLILYSLDISILGQKFLHIVLVVGIDNKKQSRL